MNNRIFIILNHLINSNKNENQIKKSNTIIIKNHVVNGSSGVNKAFRTIHTGIINDPDAANFERKKPIQLELRKQKLEQQQQETSNIELKKKKEEKKVEDIVSDNNSTLDYPYTSILILDHIFHYAESLKARTIHLKYVEQSGDTYVMFRTEDGLVPYSTFQNKHWISYLLMHATGTEEYEKAGEGEFRLEVMTDKDGRLEYTVNIIYIQGGIKLTIHKIN
jgi:hypothetical protein